MKSKLLFLNLLLVGAVIYAGMHLRDLIDEAAKRHAIVLGTYPLPPAPAKPAPIPVVPNIAPEQYGDVMGRLLLARDRTPNVEPPPPPAAKIMPTLPVVFGVFSLGDTSSVMMAEKKGIPQKGYRAGDKIGIFKLIGFNNTHIQFDWEGNVVTRTIEELRDRSGPAIELAQSAPAAAAPPPPVTKIGGSNGPGSIEIGVNMRSCEPGDTSSAGTVKDGYKKIIGETPFGKACRWEKVQ